MIKIGLDLSINSTGICINKDNKYTYYIISSKLTKKQREFTHKRVHIIEYNKEVIDKNDSYEIKEYKKTINIYNVCKCIQDIVKKHKDSHCYIEGISYGSVGSAALVDLSGLNFMVRYMLTSLGIPFTIISPTSNKKFATGNGNADKDMMIDAWKRLDKNIQDIKDIKIDDLADAFFLSQTTLENCFSIII